MLRPPPPTGPAQLAPLSHRLDRSSGRVRRLRSGTTMWAPGSTSGLTSSPPTYRTGRGSHARIALGCAAQESGPSAAGQACWVGGADTKATADRPPGLDRLPPAWSPVDLRRNAPPGTHSRMAAAGRVL